jgi:non-heme chloroperoxidase
MPTFTTNDGVVLNFLDAGAGDADRPVVVLIAGYAAPAVSWAFTQDALVAEGYRVIAFDRRSAGDSETPSFGQRMSRHGKDLEELLVTLGLTDCVLVGGSMGGSTIWAYADLFGTERVRSIVTVDQTPKMLNTADWENGFYGFTPENEGILFAEGVPQTGRGRTIDASMPAVMRLAERLGGMPAMRQADAPETIHLLKDHAVQDWRDVIDRLDVPFLMVAASDSQLWPLAHATASVARNPLGRVAVIPNTGHAVNFDDPDAFNAELLNFLASA